MGLTKTFDAGEVTVTLGNIDLTPGLGEGDTVVSVEWENDFFVHATGVGGETSRIKTQDLRATVTVQIMQTSTVNSELGAFLQADLLTPNGTTGELIVRDNAGTFTASATSAWISKPATSAFGRAHNEREWVITTGRLVPLNMGGN